MSKLIDELAKRLKVLDKPVVTAIDVYRAIDELHKIENRSGLYLRRDEPTVEDYSKYADQLSISVGMIRGARKGTWRIISKPSLSPEEMICLSDPYSHVAYLSAMRVWQLTNRIPDKIIFSRIHSSLVKQKMLEEFPSSWPQPILPITNRNIGRFRDVDYTPLISISETKAPSTSTDLGGSYTRVTTQASTFVDMLTKPVLCGGMGHVLEIFDSLYKSRGQKLHEEVVAIIDEEAVSPIVKVRGGYVLSERLGLKHPVIESWTKFAARGGSRKLDPERSYLPTFSEKWMISINA